MMKITAIIGAATLCLLTTGAVAQDRLQPDFTFKRVGVPTAGAGKRIMVQVTPAPFRPNVTAKKDGDIAREPQLTGLEWFWQTVSPDLDDTGPGRLQQALNAIENPPAGGAVPAPRLQSLQDIAQTHGLDILRATVGTKVSPALVLAIISVESGGKLQAESHAGAQGLMQLMPDTAARFNVQNSMSAADNIKGGVAYLDWLMGHFGDDPILVLAGYNAGEGSVRDAKGVPPYPETRGYVPKVLAAFAVAKGLCQTPPELVSDGCVFAINGS